MSFYRPHKRVVFINAHPDTGEVKPSMTKQSFVAECDINNIIKSFKLTGMVSHISERAAAGQYVDLPDSVDFQEALATVDQAQRAFATLPSKVRERFGHNPEAFLAFLHDPANEAEARELGLLKPISAPTAPTGGDGGSPPSEPPKAA